MHLNISSVVCALVYSSTFFLTAGGRPMQSDIVARNQLPTFHYYFDTENREPSSYGDARVAGSAPLLCEIAKAEIEEWMLVTFWKAVGFSIDVLSVDNKPALSRSCSFGCA
ncbi:hypothetical protein FB446DRAFT_748987 [Lentinula raphanica]|nr:hypothetical protein FB446DRAFT_748987 [Lentinula raphanica]